MYISSVELVHLAYIFEAPNVGVSCPLFSGTNSSTFFEAPNLSNLTTVLTLICHPCDDVIKDTTLAPQPLTAIP